MPRIQHEPERLAGYWRHKYGEPIGCAKLRQAIANSNIEANRLLDACHSVLEPLAGTLEAHADELERFFLEPVRGRSESLATLCRRYKDAVRANRRDSLPFPFRLIKQQITQNRRIAASARRQAERLPGWQAPPRHATRT